MALALYVSSDGRVRTEEYGKGGSSRFCIAERTGEGILITEFNSRCEVLNQSCMDGGDLVRGLSAYLGLDSYRLAEGSDYPGVTVQAKCKGCSSIGLRRELDLVEPSKIRNVPIVPIFVCMACRRRHYSMTDAYLRNLVDSNPLLFDEAEMREISADRGAAVRTLQEYIIRIFASKRISRIDIG